MAAPLAPLTPLPAPLALQLTGIDKAFGSPDSRTVALSQANFEARLGELMMLVGPSGCGKTSLLSILTGTLHADAGESNVLGHRLGTLSQADLTRFRREHIGFIFQDFNLIATLSVWENVAVPLLIQGCNRREAEARAGDFGASRTQRPRRRAAQASLRRPAAAHRHRARPGARAHPNCV
jgi:putative ABC transport system ATP-binding protein